MPKFTIDLSKPTYLDKGFINTGISVSDDIGGQGEVITLTLIDLSGQSQSLNAPINRTANSNNSPRLHFGRKLADWYYENKLEDKTLDVQITDMNNIKINLYNHNKIPACIEKLVTCSANTEISTNLGRITSIGFRKVAEWKLRDNTTLEYEFLSDTDSQRAKVKRNVLYAFSDDITIYYIGKTTRELKRRMDDYAYGYENLKTNKKCHDAILEKLRYNERVYIYSFYLESPLKFGEFEINIAAALEDSLIKNIEKIWNGRQKTAQEKDDEITSDELDANEGV